MKRAACLVIGCLLAQRGARMARRSTKCAATGAVPTGCCSIAKANRCSACASTKPRGAATGCALADISPALREAIVVSEDKRFYEHGGVDWRGAAAAAWANLWNTRTRGASTVTMQLTTLIDDEGKRPGRRSVGEKAQQTVGALWLDHAWRKDQILEAYLNLVPFRGEIVGLSALSQTLFGKAPSGLNEREAALTAALVRAPNAPYAKVAARACVILREMRDPRVADPCANLDSYVQLTLTRTASASVRVVGL